jgi:hypothetical protein
MGFHQWLEQQSEAKQTVRSMLAVSPTSDTWRGLIATPPGSPLELILSSFYAETDMPLEVPFFAFLHFVSGIMLEKGTKIEGPMGSFHPELWTIVLAPSGSGKSLAHKIIEGAAPVKSEFPEPASGAKFIHSLSQKSPALWFQDEIAQKLKLIESPGTPLSECKEYLLRTYDNNKIERATKLETITVQEPVLGILGLNTPASFKKALSAESLLDGFAQRFGFVWAEKDPARQMVDYALYNVDRLNKACAKAFAELAKTPVHSVYKMSTQAETAFKTAFKLLGRSDIDDSFYRRAMFRAFKYAALYHLILGKASNVIDAEDIGWGSRLCNLHLQDMSKILGGTDDFAKLKDLVDRARTTRERMQAAGKPFTQRTIQQNVRGVNSAAEAKLVMEMLG